MSKSRRSNTTPAARSTKAEAYAKQVAAAYAEGAATAKVTGPSLPPLLPDQVWLPPVRTIEERLNDMEQTIENLWEVIYDQRGAEHDRINKVERQAMASLQKHERRLQAIEKKLG